MSRKKRVAEMTPEQAEKLRAYRRAYARKHPEKRWAYLKKWRAANRDRDKLIQARWRAKHGEEQNAKSRKRRAKWLAVPENRERERVRLRLDRKLAKGRRCQSCGRTDSERQWSGNTALCSACWQLKMRNGLCRCGAARRLGSKWRTEPFCPRGCTPPVALAPMTHRVAEAVLFLADALRLLRADVVLTCETLDRIRWIPPGPARQVASSRRWIDHFVRDVMRAAYPSAALRWEGENGEGARLGFNVERVALLVADHADRAAIYLEQNGRWHGGRRPGSRNKPKSPAGRHYMKLARRITFNGETLTLAEWAGRLGVSKDAVRIRIRRHGLEVALTTPKNQPLR